MTREIDRAAMTASPPRDTMLPGVLQTPGLSWKKFVLELPVPADVSQVGREYDPIRDEPLAYFARAAFRFLTDKVTAGTRRELGRALAEQAAHGEVPSLLEAYAAAGLGHVSYSQEGDLFVYQTNDNILELPAARTPSCNVLLGFVEGLTSARTGRPALGSETRCRTMGHPACVFVVGSR